MNFKKTATIFYLVCAGTQVFLLSACGTEAGNPKKPKPSLFVREQELAGSVIGSALDEVNLSALDLSGTFSANGANAALYAIGVPHLSCRLENGLTYAESNTAGSLKKNATNSGNRMVVNSSWNETNSSKWSSANDAISCDNNAPKVRWDKVSEFQVDATFSRQKKRETDLQLLNSTVIANKGMFRSEGKRSTRVTGVVLNSDKSVFSAERRSTTEFVKDQQIISEKLGTIDLVARYKIDPNSPLLSTAEYQNGVGAYVLIHSGALEVTSLNDGSSAVTRFENVRFDANNSCSPISGKIFGSLFEDGREIEKFDIDYEQGHPRVVFGDGSEFHYIPELCELE